VKGEKEIGIVAAVTGKKAKVKVGDVIVKVDPRYYRPTEVETLLGDPTKAKREAGLGAHHALRAVGQGNGRGDYTSAKRDAWSSWPASRPTTTSSSAASMDKNARNRSHPLKKSRQPDDLYGIVAELANDLTDAVRCT
jgi:hypothetical protein